MDLLERILGKFPDGASISTLKNEMLEIDSAFDEHNLGFGGFMKFLQSAPEIVRLYQVKQIWHAKAEEAGNGSNENTSTTINSESALVKPTVDLYKRLLRKSSWRVCEASFLCDALKSLLERFPDGFTRSEEYEYLIEAFGHNRTRGELRSAIYLLYKAGYVIQQPQKQNDEYIFVANSPGSERVMSNKIDAVLVNRLVQLCKLHNTSFVPELVTQLLSNSYNKEQLKVLVANNQIP